MTVWPGTLYFSNLRLSGDRLYAASRLLGFSLKLARPPRTRIRSPANCVTPFMRIPVFARGSNPAIDRPNQRKSESYGSQEVLAGRADWIDPDDHAQGILCRAFLYSGQTLQPAVADDLARLARRSRNSLPPLEVDGSQFDDPEKTLPKRESRLCLLVRAEAYARLCEFEVVSQAQA